MKLRLCAGLLLLFAATASAQEVRSQARGTETTAVSVARPYNSQHALVIGINDYQDAWRPDTLEWRLRRRCAAVPQHLDDPVA